MKNRKDRRDRLVDGKEVAEFVSELTGLDRDEIEDVSLFVLTKSGVVYLGDKHFGKQLELWSEVASRKKLRWLWLMIANTVVLWLEQEHNIVLSRKDKDTWAGVVLENKLVRNGISDILDHVSEMLDE